jgi:cytoskeleton protein RodZ
MMEQLPENNSAKAGNSAAIPLTSLGRMLREARERLGLSVADVAAQIKFAPRQIEALEADDFKHLPEAAFLRGFVRSYAKILHLDAQTLLAALPQAKAAAAELIPASVDVPFPAAHSLQRQNLILLGAALLLAVIVVGFAVWHFTNPLKQSKVAKIATPVPLPAEKQIIPAPPVPKQNMIAPDVPAEPKLRSSATVEQSPVQAAKTEAGQTMPQSQSTDSATHHDTSTQTTALRLVFDEESWTEITDKDGKIISSRVHPRGSEMNLHGRLPLSLVIGHAATTHLYQDGEQVDLTPYINSSSEVARLTLE